MKNARFAVFAMVTILWCSTSVAAEESFGDKLKGAAISSAGSKGAEFAVKFVSGWIYNISCKPEQQTDEGSKALCSALGSLSGKTDEEWKAKVEAKLSEISNKLDVLSAGQKQILAAINSQHRVMEEQFKQLPNAVRVTAILTTIDNFWGRFNAEFKDPKREMNKTDMEKFARDVMRSNLHIQLGEFNSLLAHPIDNAQPLVKFPFYQFRQKWSQSAPPEAFDGMPTYDFAEKKFAYYRAEQQKGYLVYLWAAEIIQGECEINKDAKCEALPITSQAFAREFDRYTREQMEAFDAGANAMLLAYSRPETSVPNFLLQSAQMERILMRVNYLTSTVLGNGQGAWGQVVTTEGDPWDGKIALECGAAQTLSPVLSYSIPIDTIRVGPWIDWWGGELSRGLYNQVHFSRNWRIHHYKFEEAAAGPCRVRPVLPNNDRLPWVSPNGEVANVTKDGATYPVGFFYAIERAGGTYALASGKDWTWRDPETADSGDATKQETRFDWLVSKDHHEGLWMALLNSARVDHTVGKSIINNNQEAKVQNKLYAVDQKQIFFPEGGPVTLHLVQHGSCEKVCRGTDSNEYGILDYDVEHSPYEAGKMTAVVAVFFDQQSGYSGTDFTRARNGIFLDGSYGDTKDRKTKRVANEASGVAQVNAGPGYMLQYLVYFDLVTHSKRLDSTRYRFMGKITPSLMYLTKQ